MLLSCNCASVNNWALAWLSLLLAVAFEKYLIVLLYSGGKCFLNIYGCKFLCIHNIKPGKATAKLNSPKPAALMPQLSHETFKESRSGGARAGLGLAGILPIDNVSLQV